MTPDGSVWLRAGSDDRNDPSRDLYVITPEVVAAAE
jgi:hypothetical protein